jgi:hypothetical protein
MIRKKKLSKYLIVSGLVHIIIALAMSRIYAEQPQRHKLLRIVGTVKIQYKEPEPPPKPKVVTQVQPTKQEKPKKKTVPKKEKPKVTPQKVAPPKVAQRKPRMSAPAPGSAMLEKAPQRSRSAPGVAGFKGTRGPAGDLPGMSASGGISAPKLTTKAGGSGLSPGRIHGSMETPTGSGRLPGKGGKEVAGFRMGATQTGTGIGRVEIPGRSGSGGRDIEGPGAGLSTTTSRINRGVGKGTTGLGVGTTDGMEEIESEPTGGTPDGGDSGPGMGGHGAVESRSGPSLTTGAGAGTEGGKELPATKGLPEEKRAGATGKKEFKANLKKDMTSKTQVLDEPTSSGFEDVLQGEINRNLYSLRRMYEDWQNLKIPNIPKVLQITIELGMEKGKPKLVKIDFHNPALSPKIKDDLTKKIRDWKFKSLYDGKDDPKKWPVKLTGKISWQ